MRVLDGAGLPSGAGAGLPEAVLLAKVYVSAAIANAHPLGREWGRCIISIEWGSSGGRAAGCRRRSMRIRETELNFEVGLGLATIS